MGEHQRGRWIEIVVLLLSIAAAIWLSQTMARRIPDHSIIGIAVGLLPLLFVPLASRVFRDPEVRPIGMGRWIGVLGLMFLAGAVVEYSGQRLYPTYGRLGGLFFVLLLVVVSFGTFFILGWKRS
jgi:hypothetical protein